MMHCLGSIARIRCKYEVSRRMTSVNTKFTRPLAKSIGIIDLHFHGAFGIDLMTASPKDFRELSHRLWRTGVAGFCPTTLSAPAPLLREAVRKLGVCIREENH